MTTRQEKITYKGHELTIEYLETKASGETAQIITVTGYVDGESVTQDEKVGHENDSIEEAIELACSGVVQTIEEVRAEQESEAVRQRVDEFQEAVQTLDESK